MNPTASIPQVSGHISLAGPSPRQFRPEPRSAGSPAVPLGRAIQVRWGSTRIAGEGEARRRMAKMAFVLGIELLDREHALVEAWIEAAGARRIILERRPMHAQASADGALLHIDIPGNDPSLAERLAAVSIQLADEGDPAARPVFAQTSLMAASGFGAATYDPPTVQHVEAQRAAASA